MALYQSKYQATLDYPVYQATFTNDDFEIFGWVDLDFTDIFQITEGRGAKTDADCVTIMGRGTSDSIGVNLDFPTPQSVTTVQYNIPTGGVEITALGANNEYLCGTTTQQPDVYNWGLVDCSPPQYEMISGLRFTKTDEEELP